MDIDKFALRIRRNDANDTPPNCHFYDETERLIHELLTGCAVIRDRLRNENKFIDDPDVLKLSAVLIQFYCDYYYDTPSLPEDLKEVVELVEIVSMKRYDNGKLENGNKSLGKGRSYLRNSSFDEMTGTVNKLCKIIFQSNDWEDREYIYVE